jgi:uncharacterized membrane protein
VLVLSWVVKVGIHPQPTTDILELLRRASVGPIPGLAMVVTGVVFNGLLILLALITTTRLGRLNYKNELPTRNETRQHMSETERNWWE